MRWLRNLLIIAVVVAVVAVVLQGVMSNGNVTAQETKEALAGAKQRIAELYEGEVVFRKEEKDTKEKKREPITYVRPGDLPPPKPGEPQDEGPPAYVRGRVARAHP